LPLHSPSLKTLSILFLAFVVGGFTCTKPFWQFASTRTDENTKMNMNAAEVTAKPVAAGFEDHRELQMFGRDGRTQDVMFQGAAASNLLQHTTPSDGADFDPDVGPDGKLIVYASTRNSAKSHLYVKSINGATITQVTDGPGNESQPEFDPTGTKIAFASDRAGHWDVWVVDATGRNPIQLTNSPTPELSPSWSPDGKSIVYCRVNPRDSRNELWVVGLSNPGVKRLIGEGLFPAWSPRGDKIAYQRARAIGSRWFSIWTIDISEDEVLFPTEVASSPHAALIAPAWSADASQIAFTFIRPQSSLGDAAPVVSGDQADIGIVDSDGRGLHRLTEGNGEHFSPTWSDDGRLYFSTRSPMSETIWSLKPFRPSILDEPPSAKTASRRRAARVEAVEDAE
jgi:TolB protein